VFLSGPAGTSKSVLAVYCSLLLLNQKKVSDLIYVRTIVESASISLGSLPGTVESKVEHFISVLNDKLEELLSTGDIKKLYADERIKGLPVNYLRGASYNAKVVILDEFQNATFSEIVTALTRIGKFTKYFVLGDPMQTDLRHKEQSGFKPMFDIFNTEQARAEGIYCVEFGKEDIMRSEILKFIVEQIENYKAETNK
jgi:phosphate starvation-inducible protein PhoH